MRWPLLISFVLHAGALVVLGVHCARPRPEPRHAPTFFNMHLTELESPEVPEPVVLEPPDLSAPEVMIEPQDEPPMDEADPIDFSEFAAADPPPMPLPIPGAAVRIAPLRHRTTKPASALARPPAPQPVAAMAAAHVTSAVPRGDGCRPPAYPAEAQRLGQEGRVVLRVHVGADGTALSVEVEESSGHSLLDEAALVAVRGWTFEPACDGELPVESFLRVPFRFRLRE